MLDQLLAAALVLALQAGPDTAPDAAPDAAAAAGGTTPGRETGVAPDDYGAVRAAPTGSPQDVELWRRGDEVTLRMWEERALARRLQAKGKGEALLARLATAAAASPHEEAEQLTRVRTRLKTRWDENVELYASQWPVDPTRGCSYAHLYFDTSMRLPDGPSKRGELGAARADLQGCVDRAGVPAAAMHRANHELEEALREARKALKAADAKGIPTWPAVVAPGDAPGPAATPAPPAADAHERHEARERDEKARRREAREHQGHGERK
ncbi:MAG: hypothetical protein IPQ24_18640 [Anaeromyxobacter sp.]|nr:hypothetical protein [Anaeromyxobacter sp.]